VWDYLQKNVINVGNATLGSTCFSIRNGKASDVSEILLGGASKTTWLIDVSSTTLLVELFASSSVKKIIVQSDSFAPSTITIEYSQNGAKNSFKALKIITRDQLKKKIPFSVELNKNIEAKFLRFKLSTDKQKISLSKIEVYGSPLITAENLASIEYSKALSILYKKATEFVTKDNQAPSSSEQGDKDDSIPKSTVVFEELDSDDDDDDVAEIKKQGSKHDPQPSVASSNSRGFFFTSKL